jgi:hypothetical protein
VRRLILSVAIVVVAGIAVYAQARTSKDAVSVALMADSISHQPLHGYDGVIRTGPAETVTTAIGNVVIIVNGVRVTTDQAAWNSGSNVIEIGRNSAARIELPGKVSSLRICASAAGDKCLQ